ncbi:MAG: hypothetical protein WCJ26_03890 [bacterium]
MKIRIILYSVLISGILGIYGCGSENRELKKDAKNIADAMCKSMEAMKKLRGVNPADSVQVNRLQTEYKIVESAMSGLNQEFRKKYEKKLATGEFNDEFRKYLSEAMLECKSLSKEERETFEKESK